MGIIKDNLELKKTYNLQQEFPLETKKIIEPTISIENEFASINKNN